MTVWTIPVLMPIAVALAIAMIPQATHSPVPSNWGDTAAAVGIVMAGCTAVNAWLTRSTRLAINEKSESDKREILERMDANVDELRRELARTDVVNTKFEAFAQRVRAIETMIFRRRSKFDEEEDPNG